MLQTANMTGILVLTLTLLVCMVNGQTFPGSHYTCDKDAVARGLRLVAHPVCNLYYQCMYGAPAVVGQCGADTLFDSVDLVCKHPTEANCFSPCQDGTQRQTCCDSFIRCTHDGSYALENCPTGQRYNESTRECSNTSECFDHPVFCSVAPTAETEYTCFRKPVDGNVCVYDEYHENGNLLARRSCAAGTTFNATLCLCSLSEEECNPVVNKTRIDPLCRATLVMEFPQNRPSPVTYTERTNPRKQNPFVIRSVGYESNGYEGHFSPDPKTGETGLQIPHYANNMIKGPFIIKITFRADNRMENPLIKLVSNEGGDDCQGTLNVTAEFNAGSVEISAEAVGEKQTAQISCMFYLHSEEDITVVLKYDGTNIVGYATTPILGRTDLAGSVYVGENINNGRCNLQVAGGLVGVLKEFKVYEACGNLNRQI